MSNIVKTEKSNKVIVLSSKMIDKLSSINHFISKHLIDLHKKKEALDIKFSYIDVSDEDGMVSYLSSNKEIDFRTGQEIPDSDKWIIKSRTSVRVGAVVRSILQAKNIQFKDSDIEDFSNKFRSSNAKYRFELVKGNDIKKWYYHANYSKGDLGSSLNGSCMRHKACGSYLSVYTRNENVSLLVCIDKNEKLLSRAIVWHNAIIGRVKNQTYVDRIYCSDDRFLSTVKDYIYSQGWWCKVNQSNSCISLTNGKTTLNSPNIRVDIPLLDWNTLKKPYMDTMKYLKEDVIDGSLVVYLGNKDSKSLQHWTSTGGSWGETGYDSISKRFNVISKHFNVKSENVRYIDDAFIVKNKKYSLIKSNGQLSKFVKSNIDCLSEIDFVKFVPLNSFIQENFEAIYKAYSSRIDKYIAQRLSTSHLNSSKFYKLLSDVLADKKNVDKIIYDLERTIKSKNYSDSQYSYYSYSYSYNSYPSLNIDKSDDKKSKIKKVISYVKKNGFAFNTVVEFLNKTVYIEDIFELLDKATLNNLKRQHASYVFPNGNLTMGTLKTIFNTEDRDVLFSKVKNLINLRYIDPEYMDNASITKIVQKMGSELISHRNHNNSVDKYILTEIVDKKKKSVKKKEVKKAVKKKVLK